VHLQLVAALVVLTLLALAEAAALEAVVVLARPTAVLEMAELAELELLVKEMMAALVLVTTVVTTKVAVAAELVLLEALVLVQTRLEMVFSILGRIMQVVVVQVTIRKTLLVGVLLVLAAEDTRLETEQKIPVAAVQEQVLARQVLADQA
jgi:hypothetical protein